MTPEVAGWLAVAGNAAEDLEIIAAIMIHIGNHVPSEHCQPEWFGWFGRQLELVSTSLQEAAGEAR